MNNIRYSENSYNKCVTEREKFLWSPVKSPEKIYKYSAIPSCCSYYLKDVEKPIEFFPCDLSDEGRSEFIHSFMRFAPEWIRYEGFSISEERYEPYTRPWFSPDKFMKDEWFQKELTPSKMGIIWALKNYNLLESLYSKERDQIQYHPLKHEKIYLSVVPDSLILSKKSLKHMIDEEEDLYTWEDNQGNIYEFKDLVSKDFSYIHLKKYDLSPRGKKVFEDSIKSFDEYSYNILKQKDYEYLINPWGLCLKEEWFVPSLSVWAMGRRWRVMNHKEIVNLIA